MQHNHCKLAVTVEQLNIDLRLLLKLLLLLQQCFGNTVVLEVAVAFGFGLVWWSFADTYITVEVVTLADMVAFSFICFLCVNVDCNDIGNCVDVVGGGFVVDFCFVIVVLRFVAPFSCDWLLLWLREYWYCFGSNNDGVAANDDDDVIINDDIISCCVFLNIFQYSTIHTHTMQCNAINRSSYAV